MRLRDTMKCSRNAMKEAPMRLSEKYELTEFVSDTQIMRRADELRAEAFGQALTALRNWFAGKHGENAVSGHGKPSVTA